MKKEKFKLENERLWNCVVSDARKRDVSAKERRTRRSNGSGGNDDDDDGGGSGDNVEAPDFDATRLPLSSATIII